MSDPEPTVDIVSEDKAADGVATTTATAARQLPEERRDDEKLGNAPKAKAMYVEDAGSDEELDDRRWRRRRRRRTPVSSTVYE